MEKSRDLEFIQYLTVEHEPADDAGRLPTLSELSEQLGIGVSRLREQLEVARTLGFVKVRPRTGIQRLPYSFFPAVRHSLNYAVALDWKYFEAYSDLRNHIEAAYWYQATAALTPEDHEALHSLMGRAWEMLRGDPIQIPHDEHRELHLSIYRRLDNPFVLGILEAYWEAYENVGLNLYADYSYLERVWTYHQSMVDAIVAGDFDSGYRSLLEHKDLLFHRPPSGPTSQENPVPAVES